MTDELHHLDLMLDELSHHVAGGPRSSFLRQAEELIAVIQEVRDERGGVRHHRCMRSGVLRMVLGTCV